MMELSPFVLTLMKWSLILIILVIGLLTFNRSRAFAKGNSAKKMSFSNRRIPYAAEIDLIKNRRFNPTNIGMTVTNTGTKEIDLNAPIIIFKRWSVSYTHL